MCATADKWPVCLTAACWLLLLRLTAVASYFCVWLLCLLCRGLPVSDCCVCFADCCVWLLCRCLGLLCLTAVLALAGCWRRLTAGRLPAAGSRTWLQWLLMIAMTGRWV